MGVKTKFKNLASPFAEKFKPILLEKYILVLRWNHRYDRINVGLMYKVFEDFLKNNNIIIDDSPKYNFSPTTEIHDKTLKSGVFRFELMPYTIENYSYVMTMLGKFKPKSD